MTSTRSANDTARQARLLAAALEVFGRHGFRKTSMEDVARSAGISRQGLYLNFPSKEELFRAAVGQELDAALDEASRCLDKEGVELERRVVAALDAWLGRYVGSMLASDIANMLESPAAQLRDVVEAAISAFDARLADAIRSATTESDWQRLGVTPEEVTTVLHTIGQGSKYLSASREEFVTRTAAATHLALAGFHTTKAMREER